jgi:serine/threonine protein kinase
MSVSNNSDLSFELIYSDLPLDLKSEFNSSTYSTKINDILHANPIHKILRKKICPQPHPSNEIGEKYGIDFKNELEIMKLITDSEFFPKLLSYEYDQDDHNDFYYIYMTYYHDYVDLFYYVIDEKKTIDTFHIQKMINAVDYLHSLNILHCDIKPENFLIDNEGNIKLIDFGFSVIYKEKENKLAGTFQYCSPEQMYNMVLCSLYIKNNLPLDTDVFNNELYEYDFKSDVYSLAVTIYCCLYRTHTFQIYDYTKLMCTVNNIITKDNNYDNYLFELNKLVKLKKSTPEYIRNMMKLYKNDRPELSAIQLSSYI